ncbi:MAG: PAS domain S-box protein [Bacteroidota bacterium]
MTNYQSFTKEELILQLQEMQLMYRSLTDRKVADKEVIESEKLHRSFFEISSQGIIYQNSEGIIIEANPAAQNILGLTMDQMQGRTSYDPRWRAIKEDGSGFPGEEHPAMISLKTGKIIQGSIMGVFNPVEERLHWVNINTIPLTLEGADLPYVVYTIFDDITERRNIEIQLKENQENLNAIFNATDESIFLLSSDFTLISINEVAAKRMGRSREELIGKNVLNILPPEVIAQRKPYIDQVVATGRPVNFTDERDMRKMLSHIYPIVNDSGQMVRLAVFSRDVTDRQIALDKLRESENRYRLLAENITDIIWEQDLENNVFEYISPSVEKVLGYTVMEVMTLGIQNTITPGSKQYLESLIPGRIEQFLNGSCDSFIDEVEHVHKNGDVVWLEVTSHIIFNPEDGRMKSTGVARNISEWKKAELEKIAANEALNDYANQLSTLFNTMSEGVVLIAPDGHIIKANFAAEHIMGISKHEIESHNYISANWEIIRVDGTPMPLEEMAGPRAMVEKRAIKDIVMGVKRPDGSISWLNVSTTPVINSKGELEAVVGTFADITDKIKSEDAFRTLAIRNQIILQSVKDGIHVIDRQGCLIEANPAFCTMLGYTNQELMQLNVSDWDAQFTEEELLTKVNELISHPKIFETKHRRKDGTVIDVLLNATGVVFDGQNYLYASAHDITESNRAKELVEQTRHNYSTFFNTVDDFLWVLDTQGNIIYTNETTVKRLGYSYEELRGQSVLMVHPPDQRDEAGRIVGEMLKGTADYCPVPIMTKSGSKIPVETRVSQGFWDGSPAIFGISKDITKIRLSEEKFSKLFYLNPSACGLSDLKTHKYIEVNDAFYKLFGFNMDEVIGKSPSDLGIVSTLVTETIQKNADHSGKIINAEARLKTKNGDIRHVLLSSENIYIQDQQYRFTVVNDITDRSKMENEIKLKNEELVRLNTEKDKFFSIIGHDLRSPFNIFLGFTSMLADDYQSFTLDELQKLARAMNRSAKNLFSLLENLLEWSRMQRGLMKLKPVTFSLTQYFSDNMLALSETANKKGVEINIEIPERLSVYADQYMFGSILRNLTSNAVKFTPKGGKVTIFATSAADNAVMISVKDTGIGMSSEMIGQLFQLGEQCGRKGTEGEPSTGLGLLLCKDFIETHGGKIWLESIEGVGSTFYFTIPGKADSTT